MKRALWTLLFFFFAAVWTVACFTKDSEVEKVERASARLHEQLAETKYHEIYQQTSPQFRRNMNEEAFAAKLKDLSRQVGSVQSIERVEINPTITKYSDGVDVGWLNFDIKGDSGSCLEEIQWTVNNGKLFLEHYDCYLDPR